LLRTALGKALDLPAAAVPLRLGPNGKPELEPSDSSLAFNLSHSGNQIAVVIANNPRVGVDIEFHKRDIDVHSIAKDHFCASEIELLRAGSPEQASTYFFRFWTLKEAYLKAVGIGLGVSLSRIDVSRIRSQAPAEPEYLDGDEPCGIRVQALRAPPGYSAAVAADGPEWKAEVVPWCWNGF
jgi:4'-phosphopantetheinyl transferase